MVFQLVTFLPAAPVPRDGRSCLSGGPVEDDPEVFGGRVMHANEADLSVLFFSGKMFSARKW